MKALITGGNGFIGSMLARYLVEKGMPVRCLIYPGTSMESLEGVDVETISGDITQRESLLPAVEGMDLVYHLAGAVSDFGHRRWFHRLNVEGTENVLEASAHAHVRRVVFTSTLAVHKYSGYEDGDETAPRNCLASNPYGISKIQAEDRCRKYHEENRVETVIVRPGLFPFGPNDTTSFSRVAQALEKRYFAYVNQGRNFLCTSYVENLTHGLFLCGTEPRAAGQTYVIADKNKITWRTLIEKFCAALNARPPARSFPFRVTYPVAWLLEMMYKTVSSGKAPPITRYRVSLMARHLHFSSGKISRELGYADRFNLDEGIRRTVDWYQSWKRSKGYV